MSNSASFPGKRRRAAGQRSAVEARVAERLQARIEEGIHFFKGFLREPASVGALAPSSRALAQAMIAGFDLKKADVVVELGPGTGAFTGPILSAIGKQTTFLTLELDQEHCRNLRRRFPGLSVYHDSAENLGKYLSRHGKHHADYIISGLPWASLPLAAQHKIFEAILRHLSPTGSFTTFAYSHARCLPNAKRFRHRLEQHFDLVNLSPVVWRNFPPAFVYRCRRTASHNTSKHS